MHNDGYIPDELSNNRKLQSSLLILSREKTINNIWCICGATVITIVVM